MTPPSQIIYVENEYNDIINHFLMHHRDKVLAMVKEKRGTEEEDFPYSSSHSVHHLL